jgi:hypothetical protein
MIQGARTGQCDRNHKEKIMTAKLESSEDLVKVFDAEQESEALVVHGLLESAGIESQLTSLNIQQDIFPGVGGSIIRVRADQAEEARNMIEAYRGQPLADAEADEPETTDLEVSGEPPTGV